MENEQTDVVTEDTNDTVDTPQEESTEVEVAVEQPKAEKPRRTPEQELEHLLGRVKRLQKDLGKTVESVKEGPKPKTGELDETQLEILELKGYSETEDTDYIQSYMTRNGLTLRETLKDEIALAKLASFKAKRDVKTATPSSTKRSAPGVSDNEDYWFQKYELDGKLPEGMPKGMAEKLVNRKSGQTDVRRSPFE